ncbi:BRCA2-interacting transcriptional repressor EMSY [Halotydeus destructor]|nr:BRCA2-interacting transcriptional repressor EMSY [Halotydeus destructor]
MPTDSWPMLLDFTRPECARRLRCLELDCYAHIVSTLRAQGELTIEKKRLLHEIQAVLRIPLERHQAEIRRAANDEKLFTIAYNLTGLDNSKEWVAEGKRVVPPLPRLVPQTVFYGLADAVATVQARKNSKLPQPEETGHRVKTLHTIYHSQVDESSSPKRRRKNVLVERSNVNTSPIKRPQVAPVTMNRPSILTKPSPSLVRIPANLKPSFSSATTNVVYATSTHNVPARSSSSIITPANIPKMVIDAKAKTNIIRTPVKSPVATFPGKVNLEQKHAILSDGRIIVLPAGALQKTITLPVSQVQRGQVVTSVPPLVYQNAKGKFTVQTFKPSTSMVKTSNVVIMPSSSIIPQAKPILITTGQAHALAKPSMIHITSSSKTLQPGPGASIQSNRTMISTEPTKETINLNQSNVIEIQEETFKKLISNGQLQLPQEILQLVQNAVVSNTQKSAEPVVTSSQ